jgi:hypothetical protein
MAAPTIATPTQAWRVSRSAAAQPSHAKQGDSVQQPPVSNNSNAAEAQINRLADEFLRVFATDPGEAQAQFAASVLSMLGTLVQAHERLLELQFAQLTEIHALRQQLADQADAAGEAQP